MTGRSDSHGGSSAGRALGALLGAFVAGCTAHGHGSDASSELAPFVVREIPETAHREFIDFGGKLNLVAYELTPDGKAGPGQSVNLKLYWKPVAVIAPGWGLFTHIEDGRGHQIRNLDEAGPFRKWLAGKAPSGLGLLELGTVYLDEQSFEMPAAGDLVPEVLLVVGAWTEDQRQRYTRLPVVSGPSDGHQAGVVARIETGLEWPKVARKTDTNEVRR